MKHRIYDENGKKISVRTCVSCRECRPKEELIRIAKTKDGEACIDDYHRLGGRGAYICGKKSCIEKSVKIHGLERGIKSKVPNKIYEVLLGKYE